MKKLRFFFGGWQGLLIVGFWAGGGFAAEPDPAEGKHPLPELKIEQNDRQLHVLFHQKPVLDYEAVPSPFKPYVRQLFTPGGVQILRDSPPDHKHHHGLMFALAAEGVDFWSEVEGCGRQWPRSLNQARIDVEHGREVARIDQTLEWTAPRTNLPLLQEKRRLEVYAPAGLGATLITWRSHLAVPPGKDAVQLTGQHYFGLGMRFVPSMDAAGEFLFPDHTPEGLSVRGSERLTPARWCAYLSAVEGRPVTVAVFDHPKNPRHPNKFFTMRPFAYLAATLNLWKEPLRIPAGKPLVLTYGVAAWDGRQESRTIELLYQQWRQIVAEEQSPRETLD